MPSQIVWCQNSVLLHYCSIVTRIITTDWFRKNYMPQSTVYTRRVPEGFFGATRKDYRTAARWILTGVTSPERVSLLLPGRVVESTNDALQFSREYL